MSIFINTRPIERAKPLTLALEKNNVKVLELPLLQMVEVNLAKEDIQNITDLLYGKYDVLVVVSPTASEKGCYYIKSLSDDMSNMSSDKAFQSMQIVAVGQATADKLSEFGISTIIPKTSSNEGMLALECISKLDNNNRVMIWRGQGGRKLLIEALSERGVQVDVLELYKRQFPQTTAEEFNQWLMDCSSTNQIQNITVLISSGEAFEYWQTLVTNNNKISLIDFDYLVLGERLSKRVNSLNLRYQIIEDLQPRTILSII